MQDIGEPVDKLWSDEQLMLEAEAIVAGKFGIYPVWGLLKRIRDWYKDDRARLVARVAELEAQLAALQAAGEWEPVPNGAYHTDGPELVKVKDATLSIVRHNGNAYVDLPQGLALCRKRPPA